MANNAVISMQETLKNFGAAQWGGTGAPTSPIQEQDQRLCDACRVGNYEAAKKGLQDGANPSVKFRLALGEITPVFLCASKGYKDITELLVEYKATLNDSMDFDGTICLHHAASNGRPEMCEYLISKGCDVNAVDKLKRTPLMDAAEIGSIDVIDILVNRGANVNALDSEGHSALSYCIDFISNKEEHFFEAAVRLVEHGADPNQTGKFANRTLLHFAAAQGKLELVQDLVDQRRADPNKIDNEGKTAMQYAQDNGHTDVSEYLQERSNMGGGGCCTIL